MEKSREESEKSEDQPTESKPFYRKVIRVILIYLLIPYLTIFGLLFFFQRSLIYPGSVTGAVEITHNNFPAGQVHDVKIKTEDNLELNGWLALPDHQSAKNLEEAIKFTAEKCKVILFFSGNAQTRELRAGTIHDFTQLGYSVLIIDYRGYADNPGSPSQKWIIKDALAQWKFLTETHQIPSENIFVFGESLGGAVAIHTVSEICKNKSEPGGVLVSSTFSSLGDVASNHYPYFPVQLVLLDQWKSKQEIVNITCPISILHGTADKIVPIQFGKLLFENAPSQSTDGTSKKWIEIPGGTHNAIPHTEIRNAIQMILKNN